MDDDYKDKLKEESQKANAYNTPQKKAHEPFQSKQTSPKDFVEDNNNHIKEIIEQGPQTNRGGRAKD